MINGGDAQRDRAALQRLSRDAGLVLLYHGAWRDVPDSLRGGVHNVSPQTLYQQLSLLKSCFKVVTVDEFAHAADRRGLAAVSFDDGYVSVMDEGLPVFESLDLPFTLYLNGASVKGQVFWRDKVRFIQESGLVEAFESTMKNLQVHKRFYRYTKNPTNNSMHVVSEIDRFLERQNLTSEASALTRFCLKDADALVDHPLVTYGNHSHSHYVMSSLTPQQQFDEIEATRQLLKTLNLSTSEYFSIPFGDLADFNADTVAVARECGYRGVLLSRARAHRGDVICYGAPAVDRLMPREEGILASL